MDFRELLVRQILGEIDAADLGADRRTELPHLNRAIRLAPGAVPSLDGQLVVEVPVEAHDLSFSKVAMWEIR
ncbi:MULTISPECIES: hypothetical protein [unclassified Bradyrhizobium]|uniref:hypothetical protein n=1 Tax=unclassified Bradyrhizobium TaxID=2631580 RepID=UPI002916DAAD|nr:MULTISPECIES: hypothetical protein [unclassified Bradyrhizobium]